MKCNSILDSGCYGLIFLKLAIRNTIIHIVCLRHIEYATIHYSGVVFYFPSFDEKFL